MDKSEGGLITNVKLHFYSPNPHMNGYSLKYLLGLVTI